MSSRDRFERLRALEARLPFGAQDHAAANGAFLTWRRTGDDADRDVVLLWAYCYTYRFVLSRAASERRLAAASDVDELITRCFTQIQDNLGSVEDGTRFVAWTSIVCANALHSYRRRPAPVEFTDTEPDLSDEDALAPDEGLERDRVVILRELEGAFARLPDAVRPVARLKLLENRSYDEIAAELGHPVPTLRAYVGKALKALRKNAALRTLAGLGLPPPD